MTAFLRASLHHLRKPVRYRYLDGLLKIEQLSQQKLLEKQQQDFDQLVRFAVQHCAYYRDKYPHLSSHKGIIRPEQLGILRKQDIIKANDAMLADTVDRNSIKIAHTSGSTGQPLAYYYDDDKTELMRAGMCRSYMWSGWKPGQKIINFWGAKQDLKAAPIKDLYKNFISAEKTISAYQFDEASLASWAKTIQQYKPVLLQGYASVLAQLAEFVIDQKITMPNGLIGVYSTAEVLHDWQRQLLQQAFSCKVFNQYGSREIPNIAIECQHGNQHILTDMVYLESINGDLIITSLTNKHMPFIRYNIGDTGILKAGQCDCGSPFPMMEMQICRSNDIVTTASGKQFYPAYFHHLLDGLPMIQKYQFIQKKTNHIQLFIQLKNAIPEDIKAQLQQRIHAELDASMRLEIIPTRHINPTASGKHRFVISEID